MAGPNLDSSWPGLDSDKKEVKVDPDKLNDVAKRLEKELEKYTGQDSGTPTDLQAKAGNLGAQDFGDWDVGHAMARASSNTFSAIHPKYVKWVQQLQAAIAAIRTSAGNYSGADSATAQTAQSTYGTSGQGTPPPSQPW
jgi:hypothetical protein